jgi:hypothetical protein
MAHLEATEDLVVFENHFLNYWRLSIAFSLPLSGFPGADVRTQSRSRVNSVLKMHAYDARIQPDYFPALEYMFDPVALLPLYRPRFNGQTI